MKLLAWTFSLIIALCGTSFLIDIQTSSDWEIKNDSKVKSEISWAKFEWTNDTLSGRYFEKTAMNVPCKIVGLSNVVTFQFDIGAELTGVYENTFNSCCVHNIAAKTKIKKLKSPMHFWNKDLCFNNLELHFGDYSAVNKIGYVYDDHGEEIEKINAKDTIHLGTIGRDLFKNKVLIIDYPNKQFAICEKVPDEYNKNLINIELDKTGRVILPMKINKKTYRITFDTGSSIFPIITEVKNISKFSILPDIDTITISSWGQKHDVTGRNIKDTFELAGQKYCNVKVYANHSGLGIDDLSDGMTGNALFLNKTIMIDFRNKKMGVK